MIIKTGLNFNGSLTPLNKNRLNGIVCHHMGHVNWDVNQVHEFHQRPVADDGRGWAGIGYNYFIDFDGRIYEGRGMHQGAHARGHNSTKVGIGFQGNFETQQMTEAQVLSGNKLIEWINKEVGRPLRVYQHKDVGVTACAGRNFRMADVKNGLSKPQKNEVTDVILRQGSSGRNVEQLQSDLLSLGYDLGPAGKDGRFGPATKSAVKQFQRDSGITVDGIAGPQTFGKIEAAKQDDQEFYRVQVGAFSNEGNALAMEQQLKKAGFDTYIVKQ